MKAAKSLSENPILGENPIVCRRAFLGQLAGLPLIGGGLALIGQPTATAEPVTPDLIEAYKTWLDFELKGLTWKMAADPVFVDRYRHHPRQEDTRLGLLDAIGRMISFVGDSGRYHHGPNDDGPYSRAALVLSAVGCDWRERP